MQNAPYENGAASARASGLTLALACLDVDGTGRILSLDRAATRFLETADGALCQEEAGVFSMQPHDQFQEALEAANRAEYSCPTICKPDNAQGAEVLQVNILPFERDRIRIVLFLGQAEATDIEREIPHLTPRERAVLRLAATGLRRDRIAFELNISLPTVDMHCRNLRQKLSAVTISEAVARAMQMNLLAL